MISVTDQMGQRIELEKAPQRIVSLVPSQTELLYDLGLGDRVVGITRFCIHPRKWFDEKTRIGGTKEVKLDRIVNLKPDLIIGNKEENTKSDIEDLRDIAPVWMSDIYSLKDALQMINGIGELCDVRDESKEVITQIEQQFAQLKPRGEGKKVAYFIWKDPFMAAAQNTFIDHILTEQLGFENVLMGEERYPNVDLEKIEEPDIILLSTEPFPFNESHKEAFKQLFPDAKVELVDGEYFTWYGSRLRGAPEYFKKLYRSLELH